MERQSRNKTDPGDDTAVQCLPSASGLVRLLLEEDAVAVAVGWLLARTGTGTGTGAAYGNSADSREGHGENEDEDSSSGPGLRLSLQGPPLTGGGRGGWGAGAGSGSGVDEGVLGAALLAGRLIQLLVGARNSSSNGAEFGIETQVSSSLAADGEDGAVDDEGVTSAGMGGAAKNRNRRLLQSLGSSADVLREGNSVTSAISPARAGQPLMAAWSEAAEVLEEEDGEVLADAMLRACDDAEATGVTSASSRAVRQLRSVWTRVRAAARRAEVQVVEVDEHTLGL